MTVTSAHRRTFSLRHDLSSRLPSSSRAARRAGRSSFFELLVLLCAIAVPVSKAMAMTVSPALACSALCPRAPVGLARGGLVGVDILRPAMRGCAGACQIVHDG